MRKMRGHSTSLMLIKVSFSHRQAPEKTNVGLAGSPTRVTTIRVKNITVISKCTARYLLPETCLLIQVSILVVKKLLISSHSIKIFGRKGLGMKKK